MLKSSRKFGVLTTTGTDHVGYVARVADFLATAEANIECQSCSKLGTLYVTSTWFSAAAADMEVIESTAKAVLHDLHPQFIPMAAPKPLADSGHSIRCTLELLSSEDKPAIVKCLAALLAAKQIDINTLAAATYPAPFQGTRMFMAELRLTLPHRQMLRWLAASIEAWEARYGWDMSLTVDSDSDDRSEDTLVPHVAPFPPNRLFAHAKVSRSTDDDTAYRLAQN